MLIGKHVIASYLHDIEFASRGFKRFTLLKFFALFRSWLGRKYDSIIPYIHEQKNFEKRL